MARGKLADNSFVSSFIAKCVAKGKASHTQVCEEASLKIKEIDEKLAEVQELKKERSNLTDVVNMFGGLTQERQQKIAEKSYAVGTLDEDFAQNICDIIDESEDEATSLDELVETLGEENRTKIYHTVKELGKMRVVSRNEDKDFVRGNSWNDFYKDED